MFGINIQEILILMVVIGVLSSTGLWPRVIQGLRELRGDPSEPMNPQDMEMAYKILGLSPSSSWDEIEKAYKQKARVHHPDKGGDEDAMRVLNDVYAKLKKAKKV
ncbi:MAG: J domain-containing protein [Candidatus Hydrogenedentota bacterium]